MGDSKKSNPIDAHLEPGENILASAKLNYGSGSTGQAYLTNRRIIIYKTGSVSMRIVGDPQREVRIDEVVGVETKKMRPVVMLGVPFFFVDLELLDGSHLALRASGVGVPKLKRFADALQAATPD
jgi:hypothetical protein